MRSALERYEGPKDYIRGLSRHLFSEMSRAGLDYRNSWSKVISDGEYIVMYKGISNQIFDAMGALALDGHMKIRVMAEDFAARTRKRYLVFTIEQLNTGIACLQSEFEQRDEAAEFFDLMVATFGERLVLMADMRTRLLVKVHITAMMW